MDSNDKLAGQPEVGVPGIMPGSTLRVIVTKHQLPLLEVVDGPATAAILLDTIEMDRVRSFLRANYGAIGPVGTPEMMSDLQEAAAIPQVHPVTGAALPRVRSSADVAANHQELALELARMRADYTRMGGLLGVAVGERDELVARLERAHEARRQADARADEAEAAYTAAAGEAESLRALLNEVTMPGSSVAPAGTGIKDGDRVIWLRKVGGLNPDLGTVEGPPVIIYNVRVMHNNTLRRVAAHQLQVVNLPEPGPDTVDDEVAEATTVPMGNAYDPGQRVWVGVDGIGRWLGIIEDHAESPGVWLVRNPEGTVVAVAEGAIDGSGVGR